MNWALPKRRTVAPTSNGHIIQMQSIRKVYDTGKIQVEALRGIDLEVGRGEFVAVIGPSGSGKSTLLNLLGCLDTPSDGNYLLGGEAVAGLDRDRLADVRNRRVGFVFQNFNLLPQLTALENVEMPMLFGGIGRKERRHRAMEGLKKVGLGDRTHHRPTELSGGQMQRVAIARALSMEPDILLADEPTGNLDTATGQQILEMLIDLNRQGRTIIMVTHEPEIAEHTRRIIRLQDGQVLSDSSVKNPRQAGDRAYTRRARDIAHHENGADNNGAPSLAEEKIHPDEQSDPGSVETQSIVTQMGAEEGA